MKIAIVGPGALGCLLAGLLARSGEDVTLIDYKPARAARIRRQGIIIADPEPGAAIPVKATAATRGLGKPDLAIFCVKSYDTAAAAERLKPAVGPGTLILTLQNGLGNAEVLEAAFGPQNLLAGVTTQGVTLVGVGRVRRAGRGKAYVGWAKPALHEGKVDDEARLAAIAGLLQAIEISTEAVPRVERYIWHKLILNAALNPLGALLRVRNGELLGLAPVRELMSEIVREAVATARLVGILLPATDYMAEVEALLKQTQDNVCSMLQDVLRGRPTEVAYINGALGKTAEDMGMPLSVNSLITLLVQATEQSYPARVERL